MPHDPLCKEVIPDALSKPLVVESKAVSLHPIICNLGKETNTPFDATSFQLVVESDEMSP